MEGLTEGRIVHFVVPNGQHRPAIVTRVWNPQSGMVTLNVFADEPNDTDWAKGKNVVCETSVEYSEEPRPRTWHWIERA